ncbi:MAG: prenyltransferase/squalene oxidase repeat-containing protein, partial [Anaerolineales bacterium]
MKASWIESLGVDPLPPLLSWGDPALSYFTRRDLLEDDTGPVGALWEESRPQALVRKQQPDGSWRYPGKSYNPETGTNYHLLETYRNQRVLVEMYGFNSLHPAIQNATGYVFSCQTDEGDL